LRILVIHCYQKENRYVFMVILVPLLHLSFKWVRLRVVTFNATFNNISAISWLSVLLVEETEVPGKNHRPVASHWPTLSHKWMIYIINMLLYETEYHNTMCLDFNNSLCNLIECNTLFYIIYRYMYIESTGSKWSVCSGNIVVSNWLTYSNAFSNI